MGGERRKVYLDLPWKMHSLYKDLLLYPPEGYQIVTAEGIKEGVFQAASEWQFSYNLQKFLARRLPLNLIKSHLDRVFGKIPECIDLTYAVAHLVFRKKPWILEFGSLDDFVGGDITHFVRYKGLIERLLASRWCRKIIYPFEALRRELVMNLDSAQFEHKVEIIPWVVQKRDFTKSYSKGKVKLLFVGSANILGEFELKGGKEVLEAFAVLQQKYDNLELVVRSDIPRDIRNKYAGAKNLRLIEDRLPWDELEQEFKTADIFLLPSRGTFAPSPLEAMSYELPIVTTNSQANPEIVEDGKTGFLTAISDQVPYPPGDYLAGRGNDWLNASHTLDTKVVEEVVEKTGLLIENEGLRRRMGKAGRWEIEKGKFSLRKRNERLKQIFDEAISG